MLRIDLFITLFSCFESVHQKGAPQKTFGEPQSFSRYSNSQREPKTGLIVHSPVATGVNASANGCFVGSVNTVTK